MADDRKPSMAALSLAMLCVIVACNGSPDSESQSASEVPTPISANQAASQRTGASAQPASHPIGGETGISAGARERDLEISSYRKTDYLAFQRSIRGALSAAGQGIANVEEVSSGDVVASTTDELRAALSEAKEGTVVFLPGTTRLDLTGQSPIRVPAGVTLASDRGTARSAGALLYTNDSVEGLILPGRGSRLMGLSVMGPDPSSRTYQLERLRAEGGHDLYYAVPAAIGIRVEAADVRIENCEVWAWSRSAIEVTAGAHDVIVRHCFIHHNQRLGLGYGLYVDQAEVTAEANLFDWFRHCVAGSGRPGTSYEARYNFVLANASGHAFDMHGGDDRGDGTDVAGTRIRIHHNIVEAAQFPAVVIRGTPEESVEIFENQFRRPDPEGTIKLESGQATANVYNNRFGVSSVRPK